MDTTLNDAAFRLVSHSLTTRAKWARPDDRGTPAIDALGAQFPEADPRALAEAYRLALLLEETAIELADADRGPGDGSRGAPLTTDVLAARFPGFSRGMLGWAVEDGFMLTRK